VGPGQSLPAARRRMTRRAIPAPREGHCRQEPHRDNVRGDLKDQDVLEETSGATGMQQRLKEPRYKELLRLESRR
jgi:hypothetical protein